jgi:hypothetical protein
MREEREGERTVALKIKQAYGQDIRLGLYGRSLVDVTMVGKGVHTMPQTRDHMYIHTIGILLTWQGAKSKGYFLEMYLQGAKRSKEVCRIKDCENSMS